MKGRIITDIGQVSVDTDVIAKYAGMAAVECFGVVGMAMISVKDGLVKLLKRESMTKVSVLQSMKIIRLRLISILLQFTA